MSGCNHKLMNGKFEEPLDQLDNESEKCIAAPSVLLTLNYLGCICLCRGRGHAMPVKKGEDHF